MAIDFLQIDPEYFDHRRFRGIGFCGVVAFQFLLKSHKRRPNDGIVSADRAHPETIWCGICTIQEGVTVDDVACAMRVLAERGLIEILENGSVFIPGVARWGQRLSPAQTSSERSRKSRSRPEPVGGRDAEEAPTSRPSPPREQHRTRGNSGTNATQWDAMGRLGRVATRWDGWDELQRDGTDATRATLERERELERQMTGTALPRGTAKKVVEVDIPSQVRNGVPKPPSVPDPPPPPSRQTATGPPRNSRRCS